MLRVWSLEIVLVVPCQTVRFFEKLLQRRPILVLELVKGLAARKRNLERWVDQLGDKLEILELVPRQNRIL